MRKIESSHFTPLMGISILLTLGIIVGKVGYGYFDTIWWLVASLLTWGISFVLYQEKPSTRNETESQSQSHKKRIQFYLDGITMQCLSLYFYIFCMGGLLVSHQEDKTQESIQVISQEELSSLDRTLMNAQAFRNRVSQEMQSLSITDQDFAVIAAMTLGDKTSLSQETKDVYSISGASHVLAVSGLHIGIIFQLFILLLGGRKRSMLTIFISIIAIWAYVLFIGMPASAMRSATMISICCFALLAHKEAISINNLCLAYVIMLLFNPLYLFDISFQMSFLAVFSILLFAPTIKACFMGRRKERISLDATKKSLDSTKDRKKQMSFGHGTQWLNRMIFRQLAAWFKGMLIMSLAAQIGTMPLIAFYFGRISCYSLLTGFIAIPAATFILYLSASAMLLAPFTLVPYLTVLTTPLLHFVASCLVSITQACNTAMKLTTLLPGASIEGIKINIPQLCLIYFSIVVGYLLLKKSSLLRT